MNTAVKIGTIVGLAMVLETGTATLYSPTTQMQAQAAGLDLKRTFKKQRQKLKKFRKKNPIRKLTKSKVFRNVIVPLAIGGALQRAGVDGAFGVAIAVAVAGAPKSFQDNMARSYGNDWGWSGCISCNKRRVVVVPGREVSKQRKSAATARAFEEIKDVQRALKSLGYYKKGIDGDYGPGTKRAVSQFQASLNEKQTSWLTAEQRHLLFSRGEEAGLVRQATAVGVGVAATTAVVNSTEAAPEIETIPRYKLASSQFDKFANEYLKAGSITAVLGADLREDGVMRIRVQSADIKDGKETVLFTDAEQIFAQPHEISDEWAEMVLFDRGTGTRLSLNVLDSFNSAEEATQWIAEAEKKIAILAKLTGKEPKQKQEVVVAAEKPSAPKSQEIAIADVKEEAEDAIFNTASSESQTTVDTQGNVIETGEVVQPSSDGVEIASLNPEDVFIDKTNFGATQQSSSTGICRDTVYVSFNFPPDIERLSHYNIVPPDEILMMDNGDSTAFFSGACVQGQYDFKYVYVEHSQKEKTWKHIVKEGRFEIASNSEQCEITLSKESENAEVSCF